MIRCENADLGVFISDAVAGNLQREGTNLLRLEVARVVLNDDDSARFYIREQFRLPCAYVVLGIVSPDTKDDGIETLQVFSGDVGPIQNPHSVTDLLETLRNVVTGPGNVANEFPFLPDVRPDDFRLG